MQVSCTWSWVFCFLFLVAAVNWGGDGYSSPVEGLDRPVLTFGGFLNSLNWWSKSFIFRARQSTFTLKQIGSDSRCNLFSFHGRCILKEYLSTCDQHNTCHGWCSWQFVQNTRFQSYNSEPKKRSSKKEMGDGEEPTPFRVCILNFRDVLCICDTNSRYSPLNIALQGEDVQEFYVHKPTPILTRWLKFVHFRACQEHLTRQISNI